MVECGDAPRRDSDAGGPAWLLQRLPNVLLIPGTASTAPLHGDIAAASLPLSDEAMAVPDGIGGDD